MKSIPVDTSTLTFFAGGEVQVAKNQDGSPKIDKTGKPIFSVPLVVVGTSSGVETIIVKVAGTVPQMPAMSPIKVIGLSARPWNIDGRGGISYAATSVQPLSK